MQHIKNKYFVLFIALFLTAMLFFGANSRYFSGSSSAQNKNSDPSQPKMSKKQPPSAREIGINSRLAGLLVSQDVIFDENEVLPVETAAVKTFQIKLKSPDDLQTGDSLLERLPVGAKIEAVKSKTDDSPLRRQRSFELSPTQIVVFAVDEQKQIKWWNVQPDPRVFRAETADNRGVLSGETRFRSEAEMLVSIPAAKEIAELYFYHPDWNGQSYELKLIGTLPVSDGN